jgi:hypothetical protein
MLTDMLVDWQFRDTMVKYEDKGYTAAERESMARLVERSLAKPAKPMSRAEQAAAIRELWGGDQ